MNYLFVMDSIRKSIHRLIAEALAADHFEQRLTERIINRNGQGAEVGYESAPMQYEIVGSYIIPSEITQDILNKIDLLKVLPFPKYDWAVKLASIPIIPSKIQFTNGHNLNTIKNKQLLFIGENYSEKSNGNILYAIIRGNRLITLMFAKNYIVVDKFKLGVDFILVDWKRIQQKEYLKLKA